MDEALLLARAQFGLNIGFHILFPTITIGLAWFLLGTSACATSARATPPGSPTYKLWVKVFALSFAMGVVTGVVMSFQFGTNWPGYMNTVGEHRRAAARLRGAHRVLPRGDIPRRDAVRHEPRAGLAARTSAVVVAAGTTLSAFWILALNSWMQTPTGHVERRRPDRSPAAGSR